MSEVKVFMCDGCGVESPSCQVLISSGWYHVHACFDRQKREMPRYHACSLNCLVKVARVLRGDDVVGDETNALEAAFAAPAAAKPRSPRKPRKTT